MGTEPEYRALLADAGFSEIAVDDLPPKIQAYSTGHFFIGGHDPHEFLPMEEVERRYILQVLKSVEGNRTTAARILKLARKTLYRKSSDTAWRTCNLRDCKNNAPPFRDLLGSEFRLQAALGEPGA